MPVTLISSNPTEKRIPSDNGPVLKIAELFGDTIQGENIVGSPATFLRLKDCTLNCVWCDTQEVWRYGNPYSVKEVVDLWEQNGFIEKFKNGQHLILTGGSPLKQQESLLFLFDELWIRFGFKPIVEVENETVLMPIEKFIDCVDIWNNSPKLSNCNMRKEVRYKPEVIKFMSTLDNSFFKFVVSSERDWKEIEEDFLQPGLIKKEQIVLMPEGQTRDELSAHYEIVIDTCVKHNVRFCNREHVVIWNKKTGV